MHRLLSHDVKKRHGIGDGVFAAAHHESQRPGFGPTDAARDRGVKCTGTCCHRLIGNCAGALHIDSGTVQQDSTLSHGRDHFVGHAPQDRAVGQHRDDNIRVCRRFAA